MIALRRQGFTLMETLVALAILALAMSAGSGLLRGPSPRLEAEAAARAMCSAARLTRARALATHQPLSFSVDTERKAYASAAAPQAFLPRGAKIKLTVANSQRASESIGAIVFYPDGESSGGDIALQIGDFIATIGVNWLTGAVTCS